VVLILGVLRLPLAFFSKLPILRTDARSTHATNAPMPRHALNGTVAAKPNVNTDGPPGSIRGALMRPALQPTVNASHYLVERAIVPVRAQAPQIDPTEQ
jgi:hypothetical protein